MTLIELMIAGFVLVFGMLCVAGLLVLAIGNNGRSKIDSTGTMVAQSVVEQISAVLEGGGPGTITDSVVQSGACVAGTTWQIDQTSAPPPTGWGAALTSGNIDFTQASPPTGSYMNYSECTARPNGSPVVTNFDVRWNVQTLSSGGTYLVTVGAKPKGGMTARFSFALPVTLRVFVQSCPGGQTSHC